MPAVVTDQFRIANASNFIDSISNTSNSYYVFLGLANPTTGNRLAEGSEGVGIGRTSTWNNGTELSVPTPTDNFQYLSLYNETSLFGKKITSANVKRVITKYQWKANTRYDMYRHDYDISKNPAPNGKSGLYSTNYYVINSDYRVYVCIDNGSSGSLPKGKRSLDEPTFTDLEPTAAGTSGDGYVWKYLYTVNPSDIIKFDSTKYIVLPNDWSTSTDPQIETVRDAGNSDLYKNQIKKVYIEDAGSGYADTPTSDGLTVNILGDGEGGKAIVKVVDGSISSVDVISGGFGYTYGILDLSTLNDNSSSSATFNFAKLIPIIPPSKGHGYDLYKELGADKVLVYTRFDDSTKDFPTDTHFAQVGIIKNPTKYNSTDICKLGEYSSLSSMILTSSADISTNPTVVGAAITQAQSNGDVAKGYIASYDAETKVLKYWQDRSLYYPNYKDQLDNGDVKLIAKKVPFNKDAGKVKCLKSGIDFEVDINKTMSGITTVVGDKLINLGVNFENGLANPEINKKTGDIIYIDNREEVERDLRQKEDVKIILEF